MKHYKLLKDLPGHKAGELLVGSGAFFIFEKNVSQYALPKEIVERDTEFFIVEYPNWVQGEECYFCSMQGIVMKDYFDRESHGSLAQFGNLFKTEAEAVEKNKKLAEILQPTKTEY